MKKITAFFIFIILISLTSCDTITHYTLRLSVDRHPTLTIVNQTGHPVVVTTPLSSNINVNSRTNFQPTVQSGVIDVTYSIAQTVFTEQVTWSNADVTVNLTRRPPTLTVINQTGYQVAVTTPSSSTIANDASAYFLFAPTETNRSIDVTYRIGQMQFTEQVTVSNTDATVTLNRPPRITVINQTGYQVAVTTPSSSTIANDANAYFLFVPTETNRIIDVNYRIEQMQFTERVTVSNTDATVTLNRPPTVTVVNQSGRPIRINTPISSGINNGERTQFLSPVSNGNFNITYSSGLMQLTEQVTMRNQDVTVNITTGAPTLTIVNSTGVGNTVNIIQFRTPGSVAWTGGNIIIENNELRLSEGTAQTGVTTQALTNGERLNLWLGNLRLEGNAFDIRLQTPGGIIFQRDNVRITGNMTLTFTSADRR